MAASHWYCFRFAVPTHWVTSLACGWEKKRNIDDCLPIWVPQSDQSLADLTEAPKRLDSWLTLTVTSDRSVTLVVVVNDILVLRSQPHALPITMGYWDSDFLFDTDRPETARDQRRESATDATSHSQSQSLTDWIMNHWMSVHEDWTKEYRDIYGHLQKTASWMRTLSISHMTFLLQPWWTEYFSQTIGE